MSQFAHTPYDGSAQPFTMGLAPCPAAAWIEPDACLAAHLREKAQLLAERRDAVYRTTAGAQDGEAELLALLIDHLPRTFPHLYSRQGGAITVLPMEMTLDPADHGEAPLALAGLLVQEDFCLIRSLGDGRHALAAASLSFPSSWSLADKIGKPLEAVHAPVPGYRETLAARVNRLFERLPPGRILWRMNWSLDEGHGLHRPAPHSHDAWLDTGGDPAAHLHIRTERQTVRRLPQTGMIVFTIKIALDPLSALSAHPDAARLARGLHGQLAAMTAQQVAYKGLTRARPVILESLKRLFA